MTTVDQIIQWSQPQSLPWMVHDDRRTDTILDSLADLSESCVLRLQSSYHQGRVKQSPVGIVCLAQPRGFPRYRILKGRKNKIQ